MNLIGKKVKGFYFEDRKYDYLLYNPTMGDYIGKVGVIKEYRKHSNSYAVEFEKDWWNYPAKLIEQHLVEDEPQIIDLSNVVGVEMEVGNDKQDWIKRIIIAKYNVGFIDNNFCNWKHARSIETKKHTMAELEEILGYKFEIKEDK